jgi:hypothetical protein
MTRIPGLIVLVLIGAVCSGCATVAQTPAKPALAKSSAVPVSEAPTATASVVWFWSSPDKDLRVFRAVAILHNPGSKTLEGTKIEWVAYDSSDTIVGSYKGTEPAIPAGGDAPYVAGAGGPNLSGIPSRLEVFVRDSGHFVDTPALVYKVSAVEMTQDGKNEYTVRAKARVGADSVPSKTLFADVVLKDKSGKVVGGDFWFPENLPDTLPAGSAFKIELPFVRTTSKPASAQVTVTEREAQ